MSEQAQRAAEKLFGMPSGKWMETAPEIIDAEFAGVVAVANLRLSLQSQLAAAQQANRELDQHLGNILARMRRKVRYAASVYTDQAHAYGDLALTHIHRAVDHSRQYVLGEVHANGLENFWSLLKRGLNGTYVAVAPFHLFRYVVEQVFRFNVRKGTDASRFHVTMLNTPGKRLTYKVLTGQNDAGFMGLT
jgi:hypothetical protein